jgi:hypothetical protein
MLNGFYESWPIVYPEDAYGLARTGQTIVNATDGSIVRLFVDDEPFDLATSRLVRFERLLDMQLGVLSREVEWETLRGQRMLIRSRRLASLEHRHLAAIDYYIRAGRLGERHAARATRWMLALPARSRRITRVYAYRWQAPCRPESWDSGWFRSDGSSRPSYRVLVAELARERRLDPAATAALDPPPGPGVHDTCAGEPPPYPAAPAAARLGGTVSGQSATRFARPSLRLHRRGQPRGLHPRHARGRRTGARCNAPGWLAAVAASARARLGSVPEAFRSHRRAQRKRRLRS